MPILYSTNTNLKFVLHRDYFGGFHYAWCSPAFDYRAKGRYGAGSSMPPSSDPASIYRDLHEAAVMRPDWRCAKIIDQKATLKALAVKFADTGQISDTARDEVILLLDKAPINEWRPLLYIIPYTESLSKKVKEVPLEKRASREKEFIVEGLAADEFDVIEFPT